MRQIKFRGLTKVTREWVYGNLIITPSGDVYIFPICATDSFDRYVVDPETVGQFTGLKDANGVEIYEGDILRQQNGKHYWESVVDTDPYNPSSLLYAVETFHNVTTDSSEEMYTYERSDSRNGMKSDVAVVAKRGVIIGNIHEHQHLLS